MLYITSTVFYDENNELRVKEVYVTDEEVTYVLPYEEGFLPREYKYNVLDSQKPMFTRLLYGPVRQYPDDDARALARFLQENITKVPMNSSKAHKALYEMLSNFGEEAE